MYLGSPAGAGAARYSILKPFRSFSGFLAGGARYAGRPRESVRKYEKEERARMIDALVDRPQLFAVPLAAERHLDEDRKELRS